MRSVEGRPKSSHELQMGFDRHVAIERGRLRHVANPLHFISPATRRVDAENARCPAVGRSNPMHSFISVDLPAPFGSKRAVMPPSGIEMVRSPSASGAATVSAGAGKTVLAGLVFEALRDADVVARLVVTAREQRRAWVRPACPVRVPGSAVALLATTLCCRGMGKC
jgi:hypothetical protein